MILNEEHDEQNQQTWLSRVARERQGLSVSVEETLGDASSDELGWAEVDEHGMTSFTQSVREPSLVPPRLRLQSRVIEAVRSEDNSFADAGSYAVVPSGEVGERKPNTTTQNTNILMRFAQRLTSSFVAFNGPAQMAEASSLEQTEFGYTQSVTTGMKASALASIADIEVCTASTMTGPIPKDPKGPSTSPKEQSSRQRLAGRTTKIRLEVVPNPASHKNKAWASNSRESDRLAEEREQADLVKRGDANTTGIHLSVLSPRREEAGSTSMHLPTVNTKREERHASSQPLPEVVAEKEEARPEIFKGVLERSAQGTLSGSGFFECGQRDATVSNLYVTGASVVLVTLTSNPGPVVVQYISLQPQVGFTVHLTAPTSIKTSFNYIVLLGELF
ncbi:hypothetical protein KDK_02080 [Dictyobacter kobayashii]|uniref:Uncharacterized protein n=2 Tax=Dictyobacter kobayashii TaxID=2014872 RepID=A0A402ABA5_9CHLR|nr:hypothetical protein KDK_02080 [Dictyobacter kobayashii]